MGFTVLRHFSYGITVIVFEKLRYYGIGTLAVSGINDFGDGTTVINKICLRCYGIEYLPMSPSIERTDRTDLFYNYCRGSFPAMFCEFRSDFSSFLIFIQLYVY